MRLACYIDGFNLYHAIDELRTPTHQCLNHLKWLNLWALSESIARQNETIVAVNYFSAYATWLPDQYARHRVFIAALSHCGVSVFMARFKEKPRKCHACGNEWTSHEEKETDVHIAVKLVTDAFDDVFDRAIIISADSDLSPPINLVRSRFPNKQEGFSLCFRSHQMLIVLLRSRHGFRTVPGDVRELSDLEKLVSIAVRQAGGPVFGSN